MTRKERLSRALFALNGGLFVLGTYDGFSKEKWWLTGVYLVAALLNVIAFVKFNHKERRAITNYLVLFMNVIVAGAIALDYQWSGARFIQYAWAFAALMSGIALVLQIKKSRIVADAL